MDEIDRMRVAAYILLLCAQPGTRIMTITVNGVLAQGVSGEAPDVRSLILHDGELA